MIQKNGHSIFDMQSAELNNSKPPFAGQVKLMQVIVCRNRNALNEDPNKMRIITEVFDLNGELIASQDPGFACYTKESVIAEAIQVIELREDLSEREKNVIELLKGLIHY